MFAAKEGHVDIVKSLLDKGGEIDHTDVVSSNYKLIQIYSCEYTRLKTNNTCMDLAKY